MKFKTVCPRNARSWTAKSSQIYLSEVLSFQCVHAVQGGDELASLCLKHFDVLIYDFHSDNFYLNFLINVL